MTIRIGYACINTQLSSPNRTCRLANATSQRVVELGRLNLNALQKILEWNYQHSIRLFRISSEIIPLASHPQVQADWQEHLEPELGQIGELIKETGARVSMHPGQFTVLNSPRGDVVVAATAELEYHAQLLDAFALGPDHKIVVHLGGVYGDKAGSLARFANNYARLPERVRRRLVLENDEKNYTAADALSLSQITGAPVVFDVFHHRWNMSLEDHSLKEIIDLAAATWGPQDGPLKIHYSDQWVGKQPGSHSQTVDLDAFEKLYRQIEGLTLDVMLEVKDKEQSVLKAFRRFPELAYNPL